MDDVLTLVVETAEKLFESGPAPSRMADSQWNEGLWSSIVETGFNNMLLPESQGGIGLSPRCSLSIARIAGRSAVSIPFVEGMLATWLLSQAGISAPRGPLTIAIAPAEIVMASRGRYKVTGSADAVPWGRKATTVLVANAGERAVLAVLAPEHAKILASVNIAGEPRDRLSWEQELPESLVAPLPNDITVQDCRAFGAVFRTAQIAGAAERICAMTVEYVKQRKQFGRPLAAFQAIQHSIARMASAVAVCSAAADQAAVAFEVKSNRWLPAAIGKIAASEAVAEIAATAHQLHGAIGFTQEHSLHVLTKRLWAWRDEFGSEMDWGLAYGRWLTGRAGVTLWHALTREEQGAPS